MEIWYNLNVQGAQYPMSLNRNNAYSVKWHSRYSVYILASEWIHGITYLKHKSGAVAPWHSMVKLPLVSSGYYATLCVCVCVCVLLSELDSCD
jgi:hypothetical protein